MPGRLLVRLGQGVTGRHMAVRTRTPSVTAREVRRLFTVLGFRPLAVMRMLAWSGLQSSPRPWSKSIGVVEYCCRSCSKLSVW